VVKVVKAEAVSHNTRTHAHRSRVPSKPYLDKNVGQAFALGDGRSCRCWFVVRRCRGCLLFRLTLGRTARGHASQHLSRLISICLVLIISTGRCLGLRLWLWRALLGLLVNRHGVNRLCCWLCLLLSWAWSSLLWCSLVLRCIDSSLLTLLRVEDVSREQQVVTEAVHGPPQPRHPHSAPCTHLELSKLGQEVALVQVCHLLWLLGRQGHLSKWNPQGSHLSIPWQQRVLSGSSYGLCMLLIVVDGSGEENVQSSEDQ
jgi:hypothetical protein